MGTTILESNKTGWDNMADTWFGTTALPEYGCYVPNESELKLFPELTNKNVLDIGCGSGHSLKWCGDHGAKELWGLDFSANQMKNAKNILKENGYKHKLLNSPMEEDLLLPHDYFDVVYSIYALGWTTDLQKTIKNVTNYLKKGGIFIFSWDNPIMRCIDSSDGKLVFRGSYFDEEPFSYLQRGNLMTLQNRKMSTYINTLAQNGLMVEQLIEETDTKTIGEKTQSTDGYYTTYRAQHFPLSFIIKAKKIG